MDVKIFYKLPEQLKVGMNFNKSKFQKIQLPDINRL